MTFLKPEAIDFADISGGGEGGDVVVFKESQEVRKFVFGKESLKFNRFLIGIATNHFIEGATAMEVVDNIFANAVVVL